MGVPVFAQQTAANNFSFSYADSLSAVSRKIALGFPGFLEQEGSEQKDSGRQEFEKQRLPTVKRKITPVDHVMLSPTATCYDSSGYFYIRKDSAFLRVNNLIKLADGNLLMPGSLSVLIGGSINYKGTLIKCSTEGQVIWAKTFDSIVTPGFSLFNYYACIELRNTDIVLIGYTNNLITGNMDLIITKTNAIGNLLWSRIYKSRLWESGTGTPDFFYVHDVKQDLNNDELFLTGPNQLAGRNLIKLNALNGDIIWSKLYETTGTQDRLFGMDIIPGELRIFGRINYSDENTNYISINRINPVSGDTLGTTFFKLSDTPYNKLSFLGREKVHKLSNGDYVITGRLLGGYSSLNPNAGMLYHSAAVTFNNNLQFVGGHCFRSTPEMLEANFEHTFYPDGKSFLRLAHKNSTYSLDTYLLEMNGGSILRERKKTTTDETWVVELPSIKMGDGSNLSIRTAKSAINAATGRLLFQKTSLADSSAGCLGNDHFSIITQPISYVPAVKPMDSIGVNLFIENPPKTLIVEPLLITNKDPGCAQFSMCDSLRLTTSADTICAGSLLSIAVHRNASCGSPPVWNFDQSAIQDFNQINDSVYTVSFHGAYQGTILAALQGCNLLTDSVRVTVLSSQDTLGLGPDRQFCTGDTIVLEAAGGFLSYHWQDGVTDSIYTVHNPGTYILEATNACGSIISDTVIVSYYNSPVLQVPVDTAWLCLGDTLNIVANTGFTSYAWQPNYQLNNTVSASVLANPLVDTTYFVYVTDQWGCSQKDSVRAIINNSPVIQLGVDTSLCEGQELLLDAGSGYIAYQWSNMATTQTIQVNEAGVFHVTVSAASGCTGTDSIRIREIFPHPVLSVGNDSVICRGTVRELSVGNFSEYLWSNGSMDPSIIVTDTGYYSVTVRDQHNCEGTAFIRINEISEKPVSFLPPDTSICEHGPMIEIRSLMTFSSFLWSNQRNTPSIDISQPGVYWLEVINEKGCKGRDSIAVALKECLKGLYVPNAFTPDGNSFNETFKPLIYGRAVYFEFHVFNRWGQEIFRSFDTNRGWDGKFKSVMQEKAAYTWVCTYQLFGKERKTIKGTVLLLR